MVFTLTLPLKVASNSTLGTLLQGSAGDLAQSVGLIVATRPGERASEPDYGLPDSVGHRLRPDRVIAAVRDSDERAVEVDIDVLGSMIQSAGIHATITADGGDA